MWRCPSGQCERLSEGDNKVSALYQVRTLVLEPVVNQALLTFLVQKMTAINYTAMPRHRERG